MQPDGQPVDKETAKCFRSCVGKALYLSFDRPDVQHAVRELTKEMKARANGVGNELLAPPGAVPQRDGKPWSLAAGRRGHRLPERLLGHRLGKLQENEEELRGRGLHVGRLPHRLLQQGTVDDMP